MKLLKILTNLNWPGVTILKADDEQRSANPRSQEKNNLTNESFWLMGSPDVECKKQKDGKYIVTVNGFDYYNTKTDEIESGGASKIAMWELDTDYDGQKCISTTSILPDGRKIRRIGINLQKHYKRTLMKI